MHKKTTVHNHEWYMEKALVQAARACDKQEIPIGALVVNEHGVIIAHAGNSVESKKTQAAHAEVLAIEKAGKKIQGWRLEGCWLYVTLEPCAMCLNLALLSRMRGVVYGTESPVFGYHLDKALSHQLYKRDTFEIIAGVCADKAAAILKIFFQGKRKNAWMKQS